MVIKKLILDNGDILTSGNEILDEEKLYYEKLYSSCEPEDCNLNDLLIDSGALKLDNAAQENCEGMIALRGYCTPGPYFGRLCAFSQKIKQLRTKYSMDLVRNVPRNSKNTVLLQLRPLLWSYSAKCELINILYVLSHKSITTWVSEILVQ